MNETLFTIGAPILFQVCSLIYFLGTVKAQMDTLGKRIEKLEGDSTRGLDAYRRVDEHVHTVALSQAKVETLLGEIRTRVDQMCVKSANCPLVQGDMLGRHRKDGHREQD
jgi:hypothetical protein